MYSSFLQLWKLCQNLAYSNISLSNCLRSTAEPLFGQDYDKFNPQDYLHTYYGADTLGLHPTHLLTLKTIHDFYQSYESTEAKLKILDIGTGPVIFHTISAAPYAAEIVLSEYAEANRAALLQWLNNDPNAFDWTHIIKHVVVNLEGKSEEEVPIRAELVRKVVKAVVHCDVNHDPPIQSQYVGQYDVVTAFLCLTSACATREDFVAALVRLHALLKSGGKIVVYSTDRKEQVTSTPTSYTVGSQEFFVLQLSRDFISKSLKQAGFCNIKVTVHPRQVLGPDEPNLDIVSFSFITASKMN